MKCSIVCLMAIGLLLAARGEAQTETKPRMMYADTSRIGIPHAKDPHVVRFKGRYLMYYSIPPYKNDPQSGWNIGIAESHDLTTWQKVGEITPAPGAEYERKGLCAPGA